MFHQDVFNTEAHPFMAPPAKSGYGTSGKLAASTTEEFMLHHGELPTHQWSTFAFFALVLAPWAVLFVLVRGTAIASCGSASVR
jgi:hypothetical protein